MEIKEIIKEFEENKLEHLERARMIITVGKPSLGCDVEQMVLDNDKRMDLVSYFLNCYWLMEANIKNYKKFSKLSNYDSETIETIKEQIEYNKQHYDSVVDKVYDFTRNIV